MMIYYDVYMCMQCILVLYYEYTMNIFEHVWFMHDLWGGYVMNYLGKKELKKS